MAVAKRSQPASVSVTSTRAVGRVGLAHDESAVAHSVEAVRHRGRGDIGGVGELTRGCRTAVAAGEVGEHGPIAMGDPEVGELTVVPLVELLGEAEDRGDHPLHRGVTPGGDVRRDRGLVFLTGLGLDRGAQRRALRMHPACPIQGQGGATDRQRSGDGC